MHYSRFLASLSALLGLLFCFSQSLAQEEPTGGLSRAIVFQQAKQLTEIGRQMFSDPRLSGSGKLSCASCHDPQNAFSPSNDLAVQMGGKMLDQTAFRAAPTLTYKQVTPPFTEHYYDSEEEGDESIDNGPTGGLTWDGRVDRLSDQALIPLLSPLEMANGDRDALNAKIETYYGDLLRSVPGGAVTSEKHAFLIAGSKALEAFQQENTLFYPFTSKYDAFLHGKTELSPQEKHGLEIFVAEDKGNCASCHISMPSKTGTPPFFTDYGMIAIGIPRNRDITQNQDPNFFDLGLCGPERQDFRDRADYCGLFKTPTLRNVARRHVFFHNGSVKTLREAVAFYFERDTKPEKYYPKNADGTVLKYDDLPARYHANINNDAPFGKKPGDAPAVTEADIDALVAFLKTLNDGYEPGKENDGHVNTSSE